MGAPLYTCASYKETMEAEEYESKLRVAEARGVRGGAGDDEDDDWDRATGRCRASGGWPWVADEASASLTCPVSHVSAAVSTLSAACGFCAAALFGLGWNGSEQPSQASIRVRLAQQRSVCTTGMLGVGWPVEVINRRNINQTRYHALHTTHDVLLPRCRRSSQLFCFFRWSLGQRLRELPHY